MDIEQFVALSLGEWRSMRSGHSLAFQQFEDVLSEISIKSFEGDIKEVKHLIQLSSVHEVQHQPHRDSGGLLVAQCGAPRVF